MFKRITALLTALIMIISLAACGGNENSGTDESTTSYIRETKTTVAAVKDVTGFGVSKLAKDRDYAYTVNYFDDVQAVRDAITNGKTDLASMSLYDAVDMYANGADIKVIAANNLASMYVITKGVKVSDFPDLKNHTIYMLENDQATNHFSDTLLEDNGIEPESLDIQKMANTDELANAIKDKDKYVLMLTGADAAKLPADESRRTDLDFTAIWITQKSSLPVHSVIVAGTDYIESNPDIIDEFRTFNEVSVNYIISNSESGALHLADMGFFADAETSMSYITFYSSLNYSEKENMKKVINGTLDAVLDEELPADDFYYIK